MKRLLSLSLVLCLLVVSCLSLFGCAEVSTKDVTEDPYTAYNTALANSASAFFKDDKALLSALNEVSQKGKFSLNFALNDPTNGTMSADMALYIDAATGKTVTDIAYGAGENSLTATLYGTNGGFGIKSPFLLGTESTYLLDLDTIITKFADSPLANAVLGLSAEQKADVVTMAKQLKDSLANAEKDLAEMSALIKEIAEKLAQEVEKAKDDFTGENENYIVATYTLNNETLKSVLDVLVREATATDKLTAEEKAELTANVDEFYTTFTQSVTLSLTVKTYLAAKENLFAKASISGSVTVLTPDETTTVSVPKTSNVEISVTMSDKEIALHSELGLLGQSLGGLDIKLAKEAGAVGSDYTLTVDMSTPAAKINLFKLTTKTDAEKNFTLTVQRFDTTTAATSDIILRGTKDLTENSVAYTFNSLTIGTETIENFTLGFSAAKVESIPELPTDAKDAMDVSAEEWNTIITNVKQLISSIVPDEEYIA